MYVTQWNNSCSFLNQTHFIFKKLLDPTLKVLVQIYEAFRLNLLIWYKWKFIWKNVTPEIVNEFVNKKETTYVLASV